jgi:hypothetical protein
MHLGYLHELFDYFTWVPPWVTCAGCRKPATEVGELRVYPPALRRRVTDVAVHAYCGACALRKAVANTEEAPRRVVERWNPWVTVERDA